MYATTRLLLPFTEGIHASALNYAIQIAKQHQATLVLLALIPVRPNHNVRLELIEQAQDFLLLTSRKASRQGISIEKTQLYTQDTVRSIEAFAQEMRCEAVLLFVRHRDEILLDHATMYALLDHGACNMHIIILPDNYAHKAAHHALDVSLRPYQEQQDAFWLLLQDLFAPSEDHRAENDIRVVKVTLQPKGTFHGPA